MRKLIALAMVGGLLGCGCSMLMGGGGGGGGGMDMAKGMADSAAPYMVVVHPGVEVGQYVDHGTMWTGCTGKKGDLFVIESRMAMGAAWVTQISCCDADGNVKEAYVANYDPKGEPQTAYARKVGEKPAPVDHPAGEKPAMTEGDESVNAGGKDWDCHWVEMDIQGKKSKSWTAKNGWFGGAIKSMYDGNVTMELKACGTDAKMGFKFPEEKAAN